MAPLTLLVTVAAANVRSRKIVVERLRDNCTRMFYCIFKSRGYRQECTKNEKRCIRRKAMRYTLEDGALLYTKQDKTKVKIYYYNASCMHRTEVEKPALGGRGIDSPSRLTFYNCRKKVAQPLTLIEQSVALIEQSVALIEQSHLETANAAANV